MGWFGKKKPLIDQTTLNGIEGWLREGIVRFGDNPTMKAKFQSALRSFWRGNYTEAQVAIELMLAAYDRNRANMTPVQIGEEVILKDWLAKLK
jgi:hypothetical protein